MGNSILYKVKWRNKSLLHKEDLKLYYNIHSNMIAQVVSKVPSKTNFKRVVVINYLNRVLVANIVTNALNSTVNYNEQYSKSLKLLSKNYDIFLNFKRNDFSPIYITMVISKLYLIIH